ncbi:MAG TPA: C39 family peptidase [Candidatus Faeciplasma gallinarum]|uniref:C39 family peptidase n=1 Tax=Candidatus Faeciplasma gallinarum TaxID=2840799 RepID=A0A9D1EN03_9FIRM|nr:C39 family peptidase [Candidatus Faeciplasma gallinarum]
MNIKKVISIVLAIIIATSCLTFSLSAEQSQRDPFDPETFPSLDEQLKTILSNPNLSAEKRQEAIQIVNKIKAIKSGYSALNSRGTLMIHELDVPFYAQENDYYCGPATVKQTYAYLYYRDHGYYYSPSQSAIATNLGTTTAGTEQGEILDYINNTFNETYVVDWYFDSEEAANLMYTAISEHNRPPIIHVFDWDYYDTEGHYMNICAYNTNLSQFMVVDPYYEGHKDPDGRYLVPVSDISSFCDRMMI